MHVDWFVTDCGLAHTGDGVVKERVSLLEGLEILCREGNVHGDLHRSGIGWSQSD
jgi:hypothetical protein